MSLIPKFTIGNGCNFDSLTHTQTTGVYNADTNAGGYGSPNIETSDVDSTTLSITNLFTEITFDDITTITASSTEVETEIALDELTVDGAVVYTTTLEDGIYEFIFSVLSGDSTYTYTVRKLYLPELWSLLANASLKISGGSCSCRDKFISKWLIGFARLTALEGTSICGDITQFQNQYDFVYNYLSNLKCGC